MNREPALGARFARVVLLPNLAALVGQDGNHRAAFDFPLAEGDTVRTFLLRLSKHYPALDRELWDSRHQAIGQLVEVVINNSVLDLHHTLDSQLEAGDEVLLVPQYQGG